MEVYGKNWDRSVSVLSSYIHGLDTQTEVLRIVTSRVLGTSRQVDFHFLFTSALISQRFFPRNDERNRGGKLWSLAPFFHFLVSPTQDVSCLLSPSSPRLQSPSQLFAAAGPALSLAVVKWYLNL